VKTRDAVTTPEPFDRQCYRHALSPIAFVSRCRPESRWSSVPFRACRDDSDNLRMANGQLQTTYKLPIRRALLLLLQQKRTYF